MFFHKNFDAKPICFPNDPGCPTYVDMYEDYEEYGDDYDYPAEYADDDDGLSGKPITTYLNVKFERAFEYLSKIPIINKYIYVFAQHEFEFIV